MGAAPAARTASRIPTMAFGTGDYGAPQDNSKPWITNITRSRYQNPQAALQLGLRYSPLAPVASNVTEPGSSVDIPTTPGNAESGWVPSPVHDGSSSGQEMQFTPTALASSMGQTHDSESYVSDDSDRISSPQVLQEACVTQSYKQTASKMIIERGEVAQRDNTADEMYVCVSLKPDLLNLFSLEPHTQVPGAEELQN
jgi:hypothetical protein